MSKPSMVRQLCFVCAIGLASSWCKASSPPNIVVLLADDLGWNCVGYHNSEFETPNIDSIANDGVQLNRFYVAPMCSPTRAGFLTGRYPIRFGCARAVIPPQRDFGLPVAETTIVEMLATVGYERRGIFGKWHLGHRRSKWHPLNQGFTHFHGHYNGAIDYFRLTREDVRDWHVDHEPSNEEGYATDLIAAAAAEWITQSATSGKPFFCYVPFNAPHSPFQAPQDAVAKYGGDPTKREPTNRQIYKAMVGRMDEGIGRILQAIDETGQADNTVVWFFSDNGGVGKLRNLNKPLRGAKLSVFEGGTRVPACVRWSKAIRAGTHVDSVCGYVDLLPTLLAAAGSDADNIADRPLDGIDLLPALTGNGSPTLAKELQRPWYSYHGQPGQHDEHLAVIEQGWKLTINGPRLNSVDQVHDSDQSVRLFRLETDPHEKVDLSKDRPDKVLQLAQLLVDYRALQPEHAVPPYGVGKDGFVPPSQWQLDPSQPESLVGRHRQPTE